MCFRKRKMLKQMKNATQEHNEIIQDSLKKIKMLKIKFEENEAVRDALSGIYNQYGNITANGKHETVKADKRIASLLDDVDLCAKKLEKTGDTSEVEALVKKVRMAIAER